MAIKEHEHHTHCEHEHDNCHDHHDLFAEAGETPAVFSHTFSVEFKHTVDAETLSGKLEDWLELLCQWAKQNRYYIGHIKVIAESGNGFYLWLSTTGKQVSVTGGEGWRNVLLNHCSISITAILFNVEEHILNQFALESITAVL